MTSCSKCEKSSYCLGLCRPCYKRDHYLKNKDKVCNRQRQRRLDNPDHFKEIDHKKYRKKHPNIRCKANPKNKEELNKYKRDYYQKNKERLTLKRKEWVDKNKETVKLSKIKWSENNQERIKDSRRKYSQSEHGKLAKRVSTASRRAQKKRAQPSWVDTKELTEIYKNCPKGLEVDHIIPLQGKEVCGLHVPWNLQYLTRSENAKKSAKLILP